MRFDSSSPPDLGISIWTASHACSSISLRKPWRVYRFSPVQMGTSTACVTRAMASAFSGGTGSSSHMGLTCSFGQLDDIAHVIAPVALDGEVDIGTELFAHDLHAFHDPANVFGGEVAGVRIVAGLAESGIGFGRHA